MHHRLVTQHDHGVTCGAKKKVVEPLKQNNMTYDFILAQFWFTCKLVCSQFPAAGPYLLNYSLKFIATHKGLV